MWIQGLRQIQGNWQCFLFTAFRADPQRLQMHPFIAIGMYIFGQTLSARLLTKWWGVL